MKRFTIFAALALAAVASRAVYAQPDQPSGTATPTPTTPPPAGSDATAAGSDAAQPPLTDAMRAEIAAEVKKALAEERRQEGVDTSVDKEKPKDPNADPLGDDTYLSGSSGFMDTRLDLTWVNENMLVKPGETIPNIPGWHFGIPNSLGTLFFDNYDTRYSGYETLSHLVVYKNYRRDHLEAEGGLVIKLNEVAATASQPGTSIIGGIPIQFSDDGSYILVSYWKDPKHLDPHRISVTAFPVSGDRFRLGYSYRLSWGGNEEYQRVLNTPNAALPAVKVQFDGGDHYAFVGVKSAIVLDHADNNLKSKLAFLAGLGADLADNTVRVEANGGYFDRGPNELQDVQSQEVQLFGASAQIAVHHGMPVTSSLDYKLYKNDPERIGRVFQPVVYKPGVSWLAMSEATVLGQTLKDPEKTGSTKIQWGKAGDVNVRVMMDRVRLRLDLSYRDLAYVMHQVPSIPSYSDFPMQYKTAADFFAAVGIDRNWADRYTLGIVFGVERPASYTSPSGFPGDPVTNPSGSQTVVVRNAGPSSTTLFSILPPGKDPVAQVATKVTAQVNFGAVYAAMVNVYYTYDGNWTVGTRSGPNDEFNFAFGQFNQLGMDVTLQAKF